MYPSRRAATRQTGLGWLLAGVLAAGLAICLARLLEALRARDEMASRVMLLGVPMRREDHDFPGCRW